MAPPNAPQTVPFDGRLATGSADLPYDSLRVKRVVQGDEPEQIHIALAGAAGMAVSWVTGALSESLIAVMCGIWPQNTCSTVDMNHSPAVNHVGQACGICSMLSWNVCDAGDVLDSGAVHQGCNQESEKSQALLMAEDEAM